MSSTSGEAVATPDAAHLARGQVSFIGSLAQSVGLAGPSIGAGIVTVPLFAAVGPIAWIVWPLGTFALLCVAYGITLLSRRYLTTGGLYPLAGKAAGATAGFFTASGALFWLIVAAPATVLSTGVFVSDFLSLPAFGLTQTTVQIILISIGGGCLTAWTAYAGIRISVGVLLALELVTASLIGALLLVTLIKHHGGVIDDRQFHFHGVSVSTLLATVVLVVYSFSGFESATVLGQEAKDGRRSIPFAVIGSILVAGVFLMIVQYVTVLGFAGARLDLATSVNPLGDVAEINGIGWYEYVINGVLVVAALANNIAYFNASGRVLFTLPREGVRAKWLLRTSPRYLTPVAGIGGLLVVAIVALAVLGISHTDVPTAWRNIGSLGGYGASVMYIVTLIAVLVYLRRDEPRNWVGYGACIIGGGIMCYALYKSFNPFPAYPASVYAWVFVGCSAVAVGTYAVLRARRVRVFSGASVEQERA